ncbi:helix-turn-helix domain-containing protein [Streptomyces sp. NPDC058470]|uniref:helix-turn-helix domain-containing protein n=1 Tax=Streptomyces sp. NPDC058470 TaxID=3346515 RepID=UPI003648AA2E
MATDEKARPLSEVVGESVRKFRESRGIRQEDLADEARKYGFAWGRSSVAALEAGNRDLSINELLLIPSMIKKLGGWDQPLIPPDTRVMINENLWMSASQIPSHVFSLLAPTARPEKIPEDAVALEEEETVLLGGVEHQSSDSPELQREIAKSVVVYEVMFRELWPNRADTPWAGLTVGMEVASRVAERITMPDGFKPKRQLIQAFALGMWGRNIGDERDARTAARGTYETKRALQSARGHVTRELIEEIQAEIDRRWNEVVDVYEELDQSLGTDEAFAEWREKAMRVRHPDREVDFDDTPAARGVHRKRKFRLGR